MAKNVSVAPQSVEFNKRHSPQLQNRASWALFLRFSINVDEDAEHAIDMSEEITVADLPDDVLEKIFTIAQSFSSFVSRLSPRVTISHVSRQWRTLATSIPLLWTTVRVTPHSKLDALQELLRRSQDCDIDISFMTSPGIPSLHRRHLAHLHDVMRFLIKHAGRWGSLSVTSSHSGIDSVMRPVYSIPLPRLRALQLIRSRDGPVSHCGPMHLNPTVFSRLILCGVTIHCVRPSQFSGLTGLTIQKTSSLLMDQAILDVLSGINSPNHPPIMPRLLSLTIIAENPSIPLHPTFRMRSLVSLKLGGLSSTSPNLIPSFIQFFNALSSPTLHYLVLDKLTGSAWDAFVASLRAGNVPKYPGLRTLTLRSTDLRDLDANFAAAFPAITHLILDNVDFTSMRVLLSSNLQVWPGLILSVDGSEISR